MGGEPRSTSNTAVDAEELLEAPCWYVVHTKPRQEAFAEMVLQRVGVETFYPKVKGDRPLFTSYLFARFSAKWELRRVRYAQGVRGVVCFGGKPAPVGEDLIETIRRQMVGGYVKLVDRVDLAPGDRVVVGEGPFRGLEGVFDRRLRGRDRAIILLEWMARRCRVEVPVDTLRKVS